MHIDVSRAYIDAEELVRLPHEDIGKHDGGKIGRLRKSMHGTRSTRCKQFGEIGKATFEVGLQVGTEFAKSVSS